MELALLNGVGVVGVIVGVGWAFWRALNNGKLVTGREAGVYLTRAEKAEGLVDQLVEQNGELLKSSELTTAVMEALRREVVRDGTT